MREDNNTGSPTEPPEYVYGLLDEGIVVLRTETAEANARDWAAARDSKTWREFRTRVASEVTADVETERLLDGRTDDEPFDATRDVPGFLEGHWPEWPMFRMLFELPAEVRAVVGRPGTSMMAGDYFEIDQREEQRLVAALTALGYVCRRDDDLVSRATGY